MIGRLVSFPFGNAHYLGATSMLNSWGVLGHWKIMVKLAGDLTRPDLGPQKVAFSKGKWDPGYFRFQGSPKVGEIW